MAYTVKMVVRHDGVNAVEITSNVLESREEADAVALSALTVWGADKAVILPQPYDDEPDDNYDYNRYH